MYPKKNRLPIDEFNKLNSKKRDYFLFLIKIYPNSKGYNRFGIIISQKVEKKSTKRHYFKRQIANYLLKLPNLSLDILIIAKPTLKEGDKNKLKSELNQIISDIKNNFMIIK